MLDSPEDEDELLEMASRLHPLYEVPFRVAILQRNAGFANANNAGAAIARAALLLLLNSDVLPDRPGWLERMVAFYDPTHDIGALGPKLLYEDDSIQHAGMYFHRPRGSRCGRTRTTSRALHRDFPEANVPRAVPVVSGACMMIARDLYEAMGGLHGGYVQGDYEDADICLRMMEAGLRELVPPGRGALPPRGAVVLRQPAACPRTATTPGCTRAPGATGSSSSRTASRHLDSADCAPDARSPRCYPPRRPASWRVLRSTPRSRARRADTYALDLRGWVVGARSPVASVLVLRDGVLLRRLPVEIDRPDVAAAHPEPPGGGAERVLRDAQRARARATVRAAGRGAAGGRDPAAPGAWCGATRAPLRSSFEPRLQPLMLTTLGRTGSTAVVRMLAAHPEIVAYRPFEYEPRVATYWMGVFQALSDPASYRRQLAPTGTIDGVWWLGEQAPLPRPIRDPALDPWLGRHGDRASLPAFAQQRIERLYTEVAGAQEPAGRRLLRREVPRRPGARADAGAVSPRARGDARARLPRHGRVDVRLQREARHGRASAAIAPPATATTS